MTPESLATLCDLVGGPSRMAQMIGASYATIRRKLNGESKITKGDELKARQAVSELIGRLEIYLA